MKKIIFLIVLVLALQLQLQSRELYFPLLNTGDTCQKGSRIWLLDNNDNNKFDYLVYAGCSQTGKIYSLNDKTYNEPVNKQSAILLSGNFNSNNFLVYLINLDNSDYTHKIYYDNKYECVIMEDFSDNCEPITYEETDNYFYTQQIGNIILITKRTEIDIRSVLLCNIEGNIINNLQNISGWNQFTFDLFGQPSGIYFIRFISADKTLTKKIIYLR